MLRVRPDEPDSHASPVGHENPPLRLYVVYTGLEATIAAAQSAARLARGLNTRLVLIFPLVVPYPVPLDEPPISHEFTGALISQIIAGQESVFEVQLFLCRDREEAVRNALPAGSLVVIGRDRSWWRRRSAAALAKFLERCGHAAVWAVEPSDAQPAAQWKERLSF